VTIVAGPFLFIMPVKLDDSGKCVVEPSGKVIECHDTHEEALAHMRAINANVEKGIRGFTVKQDKNGIWHWLGIVSNNWIDKHLEWVSAKAHKRFVEMIDSGEYGPMVLNSWLVDLPGKVGQMFKEIGKRGTPDLWYWHLPISIGYSYLVGYDDRGYLVAAGQQKEGEFYSSVFKAIAETDIDHGMSHGMPTSFLKLNADNERIIDEYLSTEFTALPFDQAANWGTAFSITMKEAIMNIPKHKSQRMTEVFGEETVERFDALLSELEIFAEDSEIPRKEMQAMSEQTTANSQVEETEVEEVETEEVETEEVETEETEVDESDAADEAVDESEAETDSEEGEEEVDTGMAMDPVKFQVPTDFKQFAKEMAVAMKQVVTEIQEANNAQLAELQKQLDDQRAQIAKLKSNDEERIARKAAETPIASMAGWLATEVGSVIGKEKTRIHGNDDRALYNKTKVEEPEEVRVPGVAPMISKMITRQQSNPRGMVRVRSAADGQ